MRGGIMGNYKNLDIWKRSISLSIEIYELTEKFPNFEKFGLAGQMQRAAVSVPSNIAEGYGRHSDREFYHFLGIAKGSLNELQTQLYIAAGRGYISPEQTEKVDSEIDEIGSMLHGFIKKLAGDLGVRR